MYNEMAIFGIESAANDPGGGCVDIVAGIVSLNGVITSRFCERVPAQGAVLSDTPQSATSAGELPLAAQSTREALAGFFASVPDGAPCLVHDAHRAAEFLKAVGGTASPRPLLSTEALARICFPGLASYDLEALGESLDFLADPLPLNRALSRCELTLRLWQRIVKAAHDLPPAVPDAVRRLLASSRKDPVRDFFREVAKGRRSAPGAGPSSFRDVFAEESLPKARRDLPDPSTYASLNTDEVVRLFGRDGPLDMGLQGYEPREEQMQMASAIADALNGSRHLLVEAGTGVGKSLAYLVPAALWATANRTPVVISTNTKNLQSQLFRKDIPLIRDLLQIPFSAALIKGRRNYLCLSRFHRLLHSAASELDGRQRERLAAVLVWASTTGGGDLGEIMGGEEANDGGLWTELTSSGEECRGSDCESRRQCFLYRARRKALAADVIVANHAVVLKESGAEEGSPVLPPYAHIVFDEAHNLEGAATLLLAREISWPRLKFILHRLARPGRRRTRHGFVPRLLQQLEAAAGRLDGAPALEAGGAILTALDRIEPAALPFFRELEGILGGGGRKESVRIHPERKEEAWWTGLDEARERLSGELNRLALETGTFSVEVKRIPTETFPEGADSVRDVDAATVWLKEFVDDLAAVFGPGDGNGVSWVERVPPIQGSARAWSAPIRVGPGLAEMIYARKQSVIFTSATLTVGGTFDFLRKRLGVDDVKAERVSTLVLGTPFDYARQCRVMVPLFLPEPGEKEADYAAELGILLAEVFRRTRGRGMVLFTSFDMLRKTSRILGREMQHDGIQILQQGVSGSREAITEVFRKDVASVLMGAQSFWEGVDVMGESLSCLVVARLPFPVFTDPVVEARCEQIEAEGGNAFVDYSVPSAVIRLRQGFGRLIRHRTDRGIVIVADRRIVEKRYGQWFRRSMPVPSIPFRERGPFLDSLQAFFEDDSSA
jgi:ATP-dependent DNA helicase DinG